MLNQDTNVENQLTLPNKHIYLKHEYIANVNTVSLIYNNKI